MRYGPDELIIEQYDVTPSDQRFIAETSPGTLATAQPLSPHKPKLTVLICREWLGDATGLGLR